MIKFKVKDKSKLYESYYDRKMELKKFDIYARSFFIERFGEMKIRYNLCKKLSCNLSKEEKEQYKAEIFKNPQSDGTFCFKKTSLMQKAWEREVYDKMDSKLCCPAEKWFSGFVDGLDNFSVKIWDSDGHICGILDTDEDVVLDSSLFEVITDFAEGA